MQISLLLEKIAQSSLNSEEDVVNDNTQALIDKITKIMDGGTIWILTKKSSSNDYGQLTQTKMSSLSDECTFKYVNSQGQFFIDNDSGLFPNIFKKMKNKMNNSKRHMTRMTSQSTTQGINASSTEPLSDPQFSVWHCSHFTDTFLIIHVVGERNSL